MKRKFTIEQALKGLTCFKDNYINYVATTLYAKCSQNKFRDKVNIKYNICLSMVGKCYHIENRTFNDSAFSVYEIIGTQDKCNFIVNGYTYVPNGGENGEASIFQLSNTEIPFHEFMSPYTKQMWTEIPNYKIVRISNIFNKMKHELSSY